MPHPTYPRDHLGEWSTDTNRFEHTAKGCHYTAERGALFVTVCLTNRRHEPPCRVIRHERPIETLEDFSDAIWLGTRETIAYSTLSRT